MTCQLCPLHKTRTKMCQGSGNIKAKILIIGEAPGTDEDKIGKPFVGRSGMLLDMWLSTLKLTRQDVYIYNTVQCIPLSNNKIRAPTDDEVISCRHNLQKVINDMKPEMILTLGKTALRYFFPSKSSITDVSGKKIEMDGFLLFPLLHPSYFLRGKEKTWLPMLSLLYNHLHNTELKNPDDNSILYYDIETTSLDMNKGKIKCIGYYSDKYQKGEVITDITQFQKILNEHQFHVGYNTKDFDNPYLNRFNIFPRGKILDLMQIMKKKNPVMKKKCISFSLNHVCKTYNLGQKKEIPIDILLKEHNTEEELNLIKDYCLHDVMLTRDLFKFITKELEYFGLLMSQQDRMNYAHLTHGTGSCNYKIICNKTGIKETYSKNPIKQEYEGARVVQPKQEIYTNINGYVIDFASAYPHAIMEQNLATPCKRHNCCDNWETCKYNYHKNKIYTLYGYYCIKEFGNIESVIKDIFHQRIEFKKLKDDAKQYGCKIFLNAVYGALANPVFESIYNFDAAQDTTLTQRERHKYLEEKMIEKGYKVIGGDTDSVFVIDPYNDLDKLVIIIDEIMSNIKKVVPFPQETFRLEVEHKIKAIYFIKNKKENRQNKKLYVYITDKDEVIFKGINLVKLTSTKLAHKVMETLKPIMAKESKFKFNKKFIDDLIQEELKKDITSIATLKRVNQPDNYVNSSSLPSQIAQKYGVGNHKLIKNYKIGIGKGIKYCSLEEAKRLTIKDLDLSDVYSDLEPFIIIPKPLSLSRWS